MNPYWFVPAFTALVQLFVFLRWLHRHLRKEEMHRVFLRDMATQHLPHIYHALGLIAVHLKIPINEPPLVRFIDVNDQDTRRS